MPLWTILTGLPGAVRANVRYSTARRRHARSHSSSGPSDWYDSAGPPGATFNAPSSPPEIPAPTKVQALASAFSRRGVGVPCIAAVDDAPGSMASASSVK